LKYLNIFEDLDYSSSSSPGHGGPMQASNVGSIPGNRSAEDFDYSLGNISLLKAQLKVSGRFNKTRGQSYDFLIYNFNASAVID
jgi:hypothetical protein